MPAAWRSRLPAGQAGLRLVVVRQVVALEVDQFPRRLRARLRELGWGQKELGAAMGVGVPRICNVMTQRRLSEEVFARLTHALGVDSSYWGLPLPKAPGIKGSTLLGERVAAREAALTAEGKVRKNGKRNRDSGS